MIDSVPALSLAGLVLFRIASGRFVKVKKVIIPV